MKITFHALETKQQNKPVPKMLQITQSVTSVWLIQPNLPVDTVVAEMGGCGLRTLGTEPVDTMLHLLTTLHTLWEGKKTKKISYQKSTKK